MNAAQVAAFKQAVGGPGDGYSPESIAYVLAGIVATIVLLWAAYAIFSLGSEAQEKASDPGATTRALLYQARVLVLLVIVLYVIS